MKNDDTRRIVEVVFILGPLGKGENSPKPLNLSMLGMMITNEHISIIHSSSINHFPSQSRTPNIHTWRKGVATPDRLLMYTNVEHTTLNNS